MTPAEVFLYIHKGDEAGLKKLLKKMSKAEMLETRASLKKVVAVLRKAVKMGINEPLDLVKLAKNNGIGDVSRILSDGDDTSFTPHKHQCPLCKTVFQHDPTEVVDGFEAHQCPKDDCYGHSFTVYRGRKKPTVLNHIGGNSNGS